MGEAHTMGNMMYGMGMYGLTSPGLMYMPWGNGCYGGMQGMGMMPDLMLMPMMIMMLVCCCGVGVFAMFWCTREDEKRRAAHNIQLREIVIESLEKRHKKKRRRSHWRRHSY